MLASHAPGKLIEGFRSFFLKGFHTFPKALWVKLVAEIEEVMAEEV